MNRTRIAKELLALARQLQAIDFPSQEAMDAYMKLHPKGDRKNHRVVQNKGLPQKEQPGLPSAPVTPVAPVQKGGQKFALPQHPKVAFQTEGDLSNVDKWKAKIVIGNSMGRDQKKGQMDDVGYVGINIKGDDIIPIARGDEHQSGYEYLDHLQSVGALKEGGDYVTLTNTSNYIYSENDGKRKALAAAKWLAYGGENASVIGTNGVHYTTDMEELVQLGGKLPMKTAKPTKAGNDILTGLESVSGKISAGDQSAIEDAKRVIKKISKFMFDAISNYRNLESAEKTVARAKDVSEIAEPIRKITQDIAGMSDEKHIRHDKFTAIYGSSKESKKRVQVLASGSSAKPAKPPVSRGMKPHAESTVSKFDSAAKSLINADRGERQQEQFFKEAEDVVDHLFDTNLELDGMGAAIKKALTAISNQDIGGTSEALFGFNGIRNLMHNFLRNLQKQGVQEHKYFGNVQDALEEFNKISGR